ncbi:B-cell receptor-associated protein 29 isoform X1 [Cricetulus griseus]|uniref:B-cell receptor-associated protein n=1 Tax=Cricetulus griseus TaxID=10029 RepID=A0A9J7G0D9_CRIGR|nr:B-cell receptor-associated protein 29 isoform X1 [Cricetulus griseus]XP_027272790.1 B-cell receptor-associated protein 29 isoform X1 [Cricetulus griseus]XP_035317519.1 B-cell receptor-associated protein 29 isoform X1 [Cricetulus griseus]
MTIQWAAVASFLYAEIGLILIFCLPFIPPQRWQKIFSFSVWSKIASFWNKAFLTIIILLIVLFLDAVREVRKYSSTQVTEKSSAGRPSAYEHTQMKLFRSQRNLYISGFSLFFWLVLRRLVSLITQLAKEISNKAVLKIQAENTNKAAKKFMEENEKLKWVLKNNGKDEEQILETENKKLVEDQEKLKTELKKASDVGGVVWEGITGMASLSLWPQCALCLLFGLNVSVKMFLPPCLCFAIMDSNPQKRPFKGTKRCGNYEDAVRETFKRI